MKNKDDSEYERKYEAPETIIIKGSKKDIDSVLEIKASEIDISGLTENTEIELQYDLPDNIYLASRSRGKKLKVTVTRLKEGHE